MLGILSHCLVRTLLAAQIAERQCMPYGKKEGIGQNWEQCSMCMSPGGNACKALLTSQATLGTPPAGAWCPA